MMQKYFEMDILSSLIKKKFMIPSLSYGLKVISNESMDFNDPKEFNEPQAFDDPKGISIESMDFHNPKVYANTSIFDGLVQEAPIHFKMSVDDLAKTEFSY